RRQDDLGVDGIGANITLGTLAATPLLGGLTVKGNQLTLNGNISVDGGTGLNFSQVSTVVLGNNVTLDTDALGTGGDAGAISFGTTPVNGAFALTLDTTADMG